MSEFFGVNLPSAAAIVGTLLDRWMDAMLADEAYGDGDTSFTSIERGVYERLLIDLGILRECQESGSLIVPHALAEALARRREYWNSPVVADDVPHVVRLYIPPADAPDVARTVPVVAAWVNDHLGLAQTLHGGE